MDEFYVTYSDDEHVDNHDYDDNTDDDHDNNNELYGRACNARVNTSMYRSVGRLIAVSYTHLTLPTTPYV